MLTVPMLSHQTDRLRSDDWEQEATGGVIAQNISRVLFLRGQIDVARLEVAVNALYERHVGLRARFLKLGGVWSQVIEDHSRIALQVEDRQGATASGVARMWSSVTAERMGLDGGRLLQVRLYRLSAKEHVLCMAVEHLVCDGLSFERLVRDLWEAYESGGLENRSSYVEYALEEQRWLASEEADRLRAYWADRLRAVGACPPVAITGWQPVPNRSFEGVYMTLTLDHAETASLRAGAARRHTTLFCAIFGALVHSMTGGGTIPFGGINVPVSLRRQARWRGLVSYASTSAACLVETRPGMSVQESIEMATAATREAYRVGRLPYPEVIRLVSPELLGRHSPMPTATIDVSNAAYERPDVHGGIEVSSVIEGRIGRPFTQGLDFSFVDKGTTLELVTAADPKVVSDQIRADLLHRFRTAVMSLGVAS